MNIQPKHEDSRLATAAIPLLLIAIGAAVYANSFAGVFLFDDAPHIVENPKIQQLWPPWTVLTTRRPTLDLSLAVNFALGGAETWGYHLVNVTIHILAALTLWGVVRRMFSSAPLSNRFGPVSCWLGMAVAVVWLVHPLQTQSVTYIVQRSESLMGLFYLLTLYCVIRGAESPLRYFWYAGAVAACALGMGAKGTMVTAPLVVLLYDRTFLAETFRRMFRLRWGLYIGLAATWYVLWSCGILGSALSSRPTSSHVGFGYKGITPLSYLLTQPEVLLQYLKLSFWPQSLCLDYNWTAVQPAEAFSRPWLWLAGLGIIAALAKSIWDIVRNRPMGFAGAWFFMILAPTSSFIPIKDPAFEHRMYLPLAAVISLVVVGAYLAVERGSARFSMRPAARRILLASLVMLCAAPLAYATRQRNRDYYSSATMWADVRDKRPNNPRAHLGVGVQMHKEKRFDEAVECFRRARDIHYAYSDVHYNLAVALAARGDRVEAYQSYREAIRINSRRLEYSVSFVKTLVEDNRIDQAIRVLDDAVRDRPGATRLYDEAAELLFSRGNMDGAIAVLRRIIQISPQRAQPHINLGHALSNLDDLTGAAAAYEAAVRLDPDNASSYIHAAGALGRLGQFDRAIQALQQAIEINPNLAEAYYNLGWALRMQGRHTEAQREFQKTLGIDPNHAGARRMVEAGPPPASPATTND